MLTASCPSCASPVVFAHGAAVTAICGSCGSCVVRTDRDVATLGKVSHFDRDLSPLQVDATGVAGKRRFRVVGVVRLGRERVRWNEWAILFEDGDTGWIGESNGQFWVFDEPGKPVALGPDVQRRGARFREGSDQWVVVEAAEAEIVAADGSLPYAVSPGKKRPYADLRRVGGGVGTLDFEAEPALFAGRVTSLVDLRLEGLRPFAGWSDPALVHFRGADVSAVRTVSCEGCGSSLPIRAPGLAAITACAYCGTATTLVDGREQGAERGAEHGWEPPIALGKRGELRGREWQVIGAMVRSVTVDSIRYPWVELFLFNPWRGGAWLVCAHGHWSLVELLGELPSSTSVGVGVNHDGVDYRRFQGGAATVDAVAGEFTWEVHRGDRASTVDYIAPPLMLSSETTPGETTWSRGEYLPHEEVARGFGVALPLPSGVAPHQPNPYAAPGALPQVAMAAGSLAAVGVAGSIVADMLAANEATSVKVEALSKGDSTASEPFTVVDTWRRRTEVDISARPSSGTGLTVSLVNQTDGNVYEQSYTSGRGDDVTWRLSPGDYVARVEVHEATAPVDVRVNLVRDPADAGNLTCLGLFAAIGLVALFLGARGYFETRRWAESDGATSPGDDD
ncbi:MAG: DUF4178 domain-containing protein [Deltaproteobacteria bacterium]|nr:DUF4178 domain-containing protein [Deltaproteobacteria bacterium]